MDGGSDLNDSIAEFFGRTGMDALKGADILRTAPEKFSSNATHTLPT